MNTLISTIKDVTEEDYERWVDVISALTRKSINYGIALDYVIDNDSTLRTLSDADRTSVIDSINSKYENKVKIYFETS